MNRRVGPVAGGRVERLVVGIRVGAVGGGCRCRGAQEERVAHEAEEAEGGLTGAVGVGGDLD